MSPYIVTVNFFYIFIFFSLLPCKFNYSQQIATPKWVFDNTIYEVNIRQFTEEGNFDSFENHLPRLKELGVDILWLMPIHPIGEVNRKGTLGSYYSVKDYYAINHEFGTKEDFKELVEKIHSLGMFVIIDWVANHTAWDHPWTKTNPEFYTLDKNGKFIPPVDDWSDVIDLNFDNKQLWHEMIDALKYWVAEFNIDGYRCDVAGLIPIEFWIEARKELEKIKPVLMLAEWDTPEMHLAFDITYDWETHKIMNKIAKGENNTLNLINHIKSDREKYSATNIRMQFTDNHDENSWNGSVSERLGDAAEVFAVLTYILPSMPLIYNGQEAGLEKRLKFFDKDLIKWKENKFANLYKTLNLIRKRYDILHSGQSSGSIEFIGNNNPDKILTILRKNENQTLIGIFNLSDSAQLVSLQDNLLNSFNLLLTNIAGKVSEKEFIMNKWSYKLFIKNN